MSVSTYSFKRGAQYTIQCASDGSSFQVLNKSFKNDLPLRGMVLKTFSPNVIQVLADRANIRIGDRKLEGIIETTSKSIYSFFQHTIGNHYSNDSIVNNLVNDVVEASKLKVPKDVIEYHDLLEEIVLTHSGRKCLEFANSLKNAFKVPINLTTVRNVVLYGNGNLTENKRAIFLSALTNSPVDENFFRENLEILEKIDLDAIFNTTYKNENPHKLISSLLSSAQLSQKDTLDLISFACKVSVDYGIPLNLLDVMVTINNGSLKGDVQHCKAYLFATLLSKNPSLLTTPERLATSDSNWSLQITNIKKIFDSASDSEARLIDLLNVTKAYLYTKYPEEKLIPSFNPDSMLNPVIQNCACQVALNRLEDELFDHNGDMESNINKVFATVGRYLNHSPHLSHSQQIQLCYILIKSQSINGKIAAQLRTRFSSLISPGMKVYAELLAGDKSFAYVAKAIHEMKFLSKNEKDLAIALFISHKKIDVITAEHTLKGGIDEILPHLRYVKVEQNLQPASRCREILKKSISALEIELKNCGIYDTSLLRYNQDTLYHLKCKQIFLENVSCSGIVLPECRHFNAINLKANLIDSLGKCQTLNVKNSSIIELPSMPLCTRISIENCNLLQSLGPDFHSVEIFSAIWCRTLAILPSMPACVSFNCDFSTSIPYLPRLAPGAQISHLACAFDHTDRSLAAAHSYFWILSVVDNELRKYPKQLLLKLGKEYLLKGLEMPYIKFFKDGVPSAGVDGGGLKRDFISILFESLFQNSNQEEAIESNDSSQVVTKADPNQALKLTSSGFPISDNTADATICYKTIGHLFALCIMGYYGLKTGSLFDRKIYDTILKLSLDSHPTDQDYKVIFTAKTDFSPLVTQLIMGDKKVDVTKLSENDLKVLSYLADDMGSIVVNSSNIQKHLETIQTNALSNAKEDPEITRIYSALLDIASECKRKLGDREWNKLKKDEGNNFQKRVEGELSAAAIISKLRFTGISFKTRGFLYKWIKDLENQSDGINKLRLFVRAVTGSNSLGSTNIHILMLNNNPNYIPQSHTCLYRLDISSNYPSQQVFNEKMNLFLEHCFTGAFQIR